MCQPVKQCCGRWLSQKAWQHLVPWLREVSVECGMGYVKRRCGDKKAFGQVVPAKKQLALTINYCFCDRPWCAMCLSMSYATPLHMNHSKRFWALVGQQEANYKQLDAQLNDCWRVVPTWVDDAT
jgi:hypothetical protein